MYYDFTASTLGGGEALFRIHKNALRAASIINLTDGVEETFSSGKSLTSFKAPSLSFRFLELKTDNYYFSNKTCLLLEVVGIK